MNPTDAVDAATKISASDNPALVMALVALFVLGGVIVFLVKMLLDHYKKTNERLDKCETNHANCETNLAAARAEASSAKDSATAAHEQVQKLAQALMDATQGRHAAAQRGVQDVLNTPATPPT